MAAWRVEHHTYVNTQCYDDDDDDDDPKFIGVFETLSGNKSYMRFAFVCTCMRVKE